MDVFYIICNSIGVIVLLTLYVIVQTILVSNDNNLKWIPICSILSTILTYICYLLLNGIFCPNSLLQIALACLNCVTALCLIVGLFRRERQGIVFPTIGILGLVVFGGVPILSCSHKIINLSIPVFKYNVETLLVCIALGLGVLIISILFYFVYKSRRSFITSTNVLISLHEEIQKKLLSLTTFSGPYTKLIKEDLRLEIAEIFKEIKDEVAINTFISRRSNRNNRLDNNKQDLIYRELIEINKKIDNSNQKMPFSFSELVSNIKHSITTPLSQIQTNCELLKAKNNSDNRNEIIRRIEDATRVCLSIIHSYVEASNTISLPAFLDVKNGIKAYFNMLTGEKYQQNLHLILNNVPNTFEGYSGNYVYALVIPLLQNAIAASPEGGDIKIECGEYAEEYKICITNNCNQNLPELQQLNKPGFSTKENHEGIGLQTVRNLLSLVKTGSLSFDIAGNMVKATIQLKKRHNG